MQVYFDEKLEAGREWKLQLSDAITNADYFLCLLTRDSVSSESVVWEVAVAETLKKRRIPVMYRECERPSWADDLQTIDFDGDIDGLSRKLRDLIQQDWTEAEK